MRVVIGEDQALFRAGLVRLLAEAGFEVVAEAEDAPGLVRKVAAHRPEAVVTDVRMPPGHSDDGLRAAREIRDRFPGIAVLVLSQYVIERAAVELIGDDAAGVGYLLKDRVRDLDAFAEAIRRVADGGSALMRPTSSSRTCACRRATRTTACARRSASGGGFRALPSSCCRITWPRVRRWS